MAAAHSEKHINDCKNACPTSLMISILYHATLTHLTPQPTTIPYLPIPHHPPHPLIPPPPPTLPPHLPHHPPLPQLHPLIHPLQHIIQRQSRHIRRRQCFHLHPCLPLARYRRFDLRCSVGIPLPFLLAILLSLSRRRRDEIDFNFHTSNLQPRVRQRDQRTGELRGLDAGDAGDREGIALFQGGGREGGVGCG